MVKRITGFTLIILVTLTLAAWLRWRELAAWWTVNGNAVVPFLAGVFIVVLMGVCLLAILLGVIGLWVDARSWTSTFRHTLDACGGVLLLFGCGSLLDQVIPQGWELGTFIVGIGVLIMLAKLLDWLGVDISIPVDDDESDDDTTGLQAREPSELDWRRMDVSMKTLYRRQAEGRDERAA